MPVDHSFAFIISSAHILADHPYHPEDPKQMIHMLMGYKDRPHILPVQM